MSKFIKVLYAYVVAQDLELFAGDAAAVLPLSGALLTEQRSGNRPFAADCQLPVAVIQVTVIDAMVISASVSRCVGHGCVCGRDVLGKFVDRRRL